MTPEGLGFLVLCVVVIPVVVGTFFGLLGEVMTRLRRYAADPGDDLAAFDWYGVRRDSGWRVGPHWATAGCSRCRYAYRDDLAAVDGRVRVDHR